jgi:hypothetical protein
MNEKTITFLSLCKCIGYIRVTINRPIRQEIQAFHDDSTDRSKRFNQLMGVLRLLNGEGCSGGTTSYGYDQANKWEGWGLTPGDYNLVNWELNFDFLEQVIRNESRTQEIS